MEGPIPESLGIIAGRGAYPRLLAEASRREGVRRLFAVAFRWETDPAIARVVDEVAWIRLGQLGGMLEAFRRSGVRQAVMAGQIKPTRLFSLRMDRAMMNLLAGLRERNAHTIFGAVGEELKKNGVELLPAHLFMESAMPAPGLLGRRPPTDREQADIELGLKVAKMTSGLEIGQTVVIKNGTILSVEAFEGTDAAIRRAGKLGGPGAVVVKVAKRGHDMRFDIPVVGLHTFRSLRRIKASALAVEARRTILLEREKIIAQADRQGLCLVSVSLDEAKT